MLSQLQSRLPYTHRASRKTENGKHVNNLFTHPPLDLSAHVTLLMS